MSSADIDPTDSSPTDISPTGISPSDGSYAHSSSTDMNPSDSGHTHSKATDMNPTDSSSADTDSHEMSSTDMDPTHSSHTDSNPTDTVIEALWDVQLSPESTAARPPVACAYPQTAICDDGTVVCCYRTGTTKHSADGALAMQSSEDGGRTWSTPQVIFDGTALVPPRTVVSGGICALPGDHLLSTFGAVLELSEQTYVFGEEGQSLDRAVCFSISDDRGRTWSPPEDLDISELPRAGVTTKPLVLTDGTIGIPLEIRTHHGVQGTALLRAGGLDSVGQSGTPTVCAADATGTLNLCDARFAVLETGELLMLLWTFRERAEETINVRQCLSQDHGRTWSTPMETLIEGQVSVPLALSSGLVVAASNQRTPPAGIMLWISRDHGRSWEPDPVMVWDEGAGRISARPVRLGESSSSQGGVWEALQTFTFGTPDLVRVADDRILMTYYATRDDVAHVRACCLAVN
jgi:hypothetical protein